MPAVVSIARKSVQAGLIVLLVAAPWPFGMVQPGWTFMLEASAMVLIGTWFAVGCLEGRLTILKIPALWPALALIAYLALTLVPLPASVIDAASPAAADLYRAAAGAAAKEPSSLAFPITLAPFDSTHEILLTAAYVCFFIAMLHAGRRELGLFGGLNAVVANGAAVGVFGIVQNLWSNGRIYWAFEPGSGTPFGPFPNHNHFAGYIELALGPALGMLVAELRKPQDGDSGGNPLSRFVHPRSGRLWYLTTASFLMLIALSASLSRGGVLAVMTTVLLFAALVLIRKPAADNSPREGRLNRGRTAAVGLALVLLVLVVLALAPPLRERWLQTGGSAVNYRLLLWRDSLGAIPDFVLTGAGAGSFASLFPAYKNRAFLSRETHAENEYLQWLIETGLIGSLLLAAAAAIFAASVCRRLALRRDPEIRAVTTGTVFGLASFSIHNCWDFNAHIPSNALTFIALAAMALLAVSRKRARGDGRVAIDAWRFHPRAAARPLLAALLLFAAGAGVFVSFALFRSRALVAEWHRHPQPDATQAVDATPGRLQESLEWFGWNDEALALSAAFHERQARDAGFFQVLQRHTALEAARKDAVAALSLRPVSGRHWASVGRNASMRQDFVFAEQCFAHAEKLARTDGEVFRDHGYSLLAQGNTAAAAGRFAIARSFNPGMNLREMLDALAKRTSDPEIWERVVRRNPDDLGVYVSFLEARGLLQRAEKVRAMENALRPRAGPE